MSKPVGINPPSTVDLEVVDTEPSMKGATASASYKPAKLETGVTVQVPPFITGRRQSASRPDRRLVSGAG